MQEINRELTIYGHVLNGFLTSAVSVPIVHPGYTLCSHFLIHKNVNELMTGGRPNFRVIYRGIGANWACDMSGQVIAFWSYGYFQSLSIKHRECIGGVAAGIIAAPIFNMWDRIMTLQHISGDSMKLTVKKIKRAEGLKGLFKGSSLTCMQEILYQTTFFSLSNKMADKIEKKTNTNPIFSRVISYSATGAIIGLVTSPLQHVKILLMGELNSESITVIAKKAFSPEKIKEVILFTKMRTSLITLNMFVAGLIKEFIPLLLPSSFKVD